jgi:formylglycine-generating enzyme required for sulfatase activity
MGERLVRATIICVAAGLALLSGGAQISAQSLTDAQERALKPGDKFKECAACPEMVVVPSGSFMMGSPSDEPGRNNNEGPQHQVTFARQFAVGRFAVTFAEWDACRTDRACRYRPTDDGQGRGNRPVTYIPWKQTQIFLAWLSRKTGKKYRLLTEAEREYVTRAGTTTPYWWGSTLSPQQANYCAETDPNKIGKSDTCRFKALPVDRYQPNPWGLFQVLGNVSEWVEDCYNDSYRGAPTDGSAWKTGTHFVGSRSCSRVVRGSSFTSEPGGVRSAHREQDDGEMDMGPSDRGFRVARTLATP